MAKQRTLKVRLWRAKDSGVALVGGAEVHIRQDKTIVVDGDPLLAGRQHMFEPVEFDYPLPASALAPEEETVAAKRGGK